MQYNIAGSLFRAERLYRLATLVQTYFAVGMLGNHPATQHTDAKPAEVEVDARYGACEITHSPWCADREGVVGAGLVRGRIALDAQVCTGGATND